MIGVDVPDETSVLPSIGAQVERLVALGVHGLAGVTATRFREQASSVRGLLVVHPRFVPASALAPLLVHDGRPGFVVVDLADLDSFDPIEGLDLPVGPLYGVQGPERGDALANRSPDEALPAITAAGRTPLTVSEGICWLLQRPDVLERNRCFMTIGSRLRKPDGAGAGLDARTPAIWISNGTGRDGRERKNAPKVGWCWAGNRHTWLGFASATSRG